MINSRKLSGRVPKPGTPLKVLIALDRKPDDTWLRELKNSVAL